MKSLQFTPQVEYSKEEAITVTDIYENVLFTKMHEKIIRKTKISNIIEPLKIVANEFNLNLNKCRERKLASKIMTIYAKNN